MLRITTLNRVFGILLLAGFTVAAADTIPNHYTILLQDPPVAERFAASSLRTKEAVDYRMQIETAQKKLRAELEKRQIKVTGAVSTVLNAIFVTAPASRVPELQSLPGVKAVVPSRRYHRQLNKATQMLNAPAAWNALGGIDNAGKGIKIAILDSGIDQTHPAFQDSSLPMPSGFPICSDGDCAFTNNKVIVARSYVRQLAAGNSPDPAVDSRPDDYSARDRDGHGTAVASCAAGDQNSGGLVTFSGFAPKAYLGNYKIYGSPGVNDYSSDAVIIQALEDAYKDGMEVVNFSTGGPAFSGPLESGSVCGNNPGVPCDLVAQTFETLANRGLVIVSAAGNEGFDGVASNLPTYNTIGSPADAPSVIAVGAVTNSHTFSDTVSAIGSNAPSSLQNITADPGDSNISGGSITAPLVDVTQIGDDGLACSTLRPGSLSGSIALIERGTCDFSVKLGNAQDAGAAAAIFYMATSAPLVSPGGLSSFNIPGVMISNIDGVALKNYIDSNPGQKVSINTSGAEQPAQGGRVAYFSSIGPTTGDSFLKPDLLAVGTDVYMAGESYDPAGALYSSNGYVVADGTSFATPMVAGAAALVKQKNPNFSSAQIKSAVTNTAANTVTTDDSGNPVDVRSTGAGLLDAGAAVSTTVTAVPSSVSFGVLNSTNHLTSQSIQLVNSGPAAQNLTLSISIAVASSGTAVQIDHNSVSLNPGTSQTVNVSLSGSGVPPPGAYSGAVLVQGQGLSLRIPYLYLVGDGVPANLIPLTGMTFDGTVGGGIPDGIISIKLIDDYGVPVANAPVTFTARGGSLQSADSNTDQYGIAAAQPVLGSTPGNVTFTARAGGMSTDFTGFSRPQPTIGAGGIVDGASFQAGKAVAPGSYVSIFGTGLSDTTDYAQTSRLPLAIDQAIVSFDVPSAGISVPGHLIYVSDGQVNVQVPWELQGQSSAQVKVTIDYSNGNVVTLPLATYAPAVFQSGGIAAALDGSNAAVTTSHPIPRGQVVQLFANGLGPVTNQPASGDPASSSPLSETTSPVTVTIGGQNATVQFNGLAPGFPGLYQVNAVVPPGINAGRQPVVLSIGGVSSAPVNIPVQ